MEVKINLRDNILFAFFNFVIISFLQKCSRQKKSWERAGSRKVSQNCFDDIFVLVQVTNENGESAEKIQNKKILKLHPNEQGPKCTVPLVTQP